MVVVAWQSLVPGDDVLLRTTFDKAGHAAVYAVLGALAVLAMRRPRFAAAWLAIVAFGLVLEIAQRLTGYRSFELADLLADAVGAAVGAGAVVVLVARRPRRGT